MKIKLLLILLLLTFHKSQAQKAAPKQQIQFTTDTLYFDQDWEKTALIEDSKYARIIKRTTDGKPYGTVRDFYYPTWKKQWEGKLLSENPDVPNGFCTYWYLNGKVHSSATFINGEPQDDLQMWNEDGTKITCEYKYVESLPLTKVKLHSQYNTGSSRTVQPVSLPANALGIVYRFDIRDEGQPPVGWTTVAALATASMTGGTSAMLLAGAKAMATSSTESTSPTVNTKCHFYVTTSLKDVEFFRESKGSIPKENSCIWQGRNVTQETRHLAIPKGVKAVYFCINNDNYQTSAEATLNVSVLQSQCK